MIKKNIVKGVKKYSTTERLYTKVITALQAGSLIISSSNNQKETFKGSGRQDLFFSYCMYYQEKIV